MTKGQFLIDSDLSSIWIKMKLALFKDCNVQMTDTYEMVGEYLAVCSNPTLTTLADTFIMMQYFETFNH